MRKILIIDDDKTFLKIYTTYLTAEGFDVSQASTGEEALLYFSEPKFDAILLDIRMPGTSGWALMNTLTQVHPESKIIAFSCYPLHIQKEMLPEAVSYYDKGSGLKELLSQLKSAFQQQPAASPA